MLHRWLLSQQSLQLRMLLLLLLQKQRSLFRPQRFLLYIRSSDCLYAGLRGMPAVRAASRLTALLIADRSWRRRSAIVRRRVHDGYFHATRSRSSAERSCAASRPCELPSDCYRYLTTYGTCVTTYRRAADERSRADVL